MLKLVAEPAAWATGNRLRGAGTCRRAQARGPRHHQPRHRQPDFKTRNTSWKPPSRRCATGITANTPAQGILPLREAVVADLDRRHGKVNVHPDNVVIMPGGKPTSSSPSCCSASRRGDHVSRPRFPIYRSMIQYNGATPVPIALKEENGFAFTADQVLSQITPKTSLIIINSPNNPCGGAVSADEVKKLVAGLAKHPDVALMSDEIYSQMLYRRPPPREPAQVSRDPRPADHPRRLVQDLRHDRLASRLLGVPKAIVEHVVRLAVNSHSCFNAPTQFGGIAALEGPQDEVHKMVAPFDERRRVIVPLLNELPGFRCLDPAAPSMPSPTSRAPA